jgi:3-(3-hydroxy-phenyl)propionate hydroxylase
MVHTMNRLEKTDCDVAIVGLGPVGAALANLLGSRGIRTTVLERQAAAFPQPRAGVIDDEALRTLQACGVYETAARDMLLGVGAQWASADDAVLLTTFPRAEPQGHPWLSMMYQPLLDGALREGLTALPTVDVLLGRHVTALDDDGTAMVVAYEAPDGTPHRLRASYVVGCDGANSTVRELCGIEMVGSSWQQPWLIIDARLPALVPTVPYLRFTMDPRRPRVTALLAAGVHRWERMVLPDEDPEALLTDAAARELIAHNADPDTAEILRQVIYTFHSKRATRWRDGRVLLCGDAAHLMPPTGGQGLNSGLRDATNLAWKLAAVVRGEASTQLLNTYEAERRPHVEELTALSERIGRAVVVGSPAVAALRDAGLRVLGVTPGARGFIREGRFRQPARYRGGLVVTADRPGPSAAGRLFPQPRVRRFTGERLRLDDVAGHGWRIVGWHADPSEALSSAGQRVADALGARLVTLCRPGARPTSGAPSTDLLEDVDGVAAPFFKHNPFVVLRPDHFICANPSKDELNGALEEIARRLGSGAELAMSDDPPAGEWVIEPLGSEVRFDARGFWGLAPVSGTFERVRGTLTIDPDGSCAAALRAEAAGIRTGIAIRDAHLRSREFLAARRHPEISFTGTGRLDDRQVALDGALEVAGVRRDVEVVATVDRESTTLVLRCELVIDLADFGIHPPLGLVRPRVALGVVAAVQPAPAADRDDDAPASAIS